MGVQAIQSFGLLGHVKLPFVEYMRAFGTGSGHAGLAFAKEQGSFLGSTHGQGTCETGEEPFGLIGKGG